MASKHVKVVEESWPDLLVRLHHMQAELQRMLDQLNAKKRPARLWKYEQHLRKWLKKSIAWIGVLAGGRPPPFGKDAAMVALALWELDQERPRFVDDFHKFLEAAGEQYYAE